MPLASQSCQLSSQQSISVMAGFSDVYKRQEYTVLAVGDIPYAVGPQHGHMLDIYFTLPADEYLRQVGKTNPLTTSFDVEESCVCLLYTSGIPIKQRYKACLRTIFFNCRPVVPTVFKSP